MVRTICESCYHVLIYKRYHDGNNNSKITSRVVTWKSENKSLLIVCIRLNVNSLYVKCVLLSCHLYSDQATCFVKLFKDLLRPCGQALLIPFTDVTMSQIIKWLILSKTLSDWRMHKRKWQLSTQHDYCCVSCNSKTYVYKKKVSQILMMICAVQYHLQTIGIQLSW
jgi:hypothetical protein